MKIQTTLALGMAFVLLSQSSTSVALTRQKMSQEGQEVLKSVFSQRDLIVLQRQRTERRTEIKRLLELDHPDWKAVKTLLEADYADDLRIRQKGIELERRLLDKLPEADRLMWLRDRYAPPPPAPIILSPKKNP